MNSTYPRQFEIILERKYTSLNFQPLWPFKKHTVSQGFKEETKMYMW